MLAHEGVAECRRIVIVLPARVRHHPIEIVEHAGDEQALVALPRLDRRIDGQPVLADKVRDDGLAVADGLAVVDQVGQLPARRLRRVENVLMRERHMGELEEGENLQPVAVIVGDAEQGRIGVERDHCGDGCSLN